MELYERPVDTFIARFLGESNLLAGTVETVSGDGGTIAVAGFGEPFQGRLADGLRAGARASALLRPEAIQPRAGGLPARVVERVYLGELVAVRLALASGHELWSRRLASEWSGRDAVEIGWDASAISILPDAPS
jgi:ABC-type Fe3+/spermidine/putrescine transport system ATPase subunit